MSSHSTRILTLVFVFILAGGAHAQPDPGDIGIYADPGGTQSGMWFVGGGQATFYVVAFDLSGDPQGYEFGVWMPSDFVILDTVWWGEEPTVIGDVRNAQVGSGACLDGSGTIVLAEFTVGTFRAVGSEQLVCIGPSEPSSFDPPMPGYYTCDAALIPFGLAQHGSPYFPGGCMVLNPLCESRWWLQVDDVLAPAGSSARVPVYVAQGTRYYWKSDGAVAKTDFCVRPTILGLEFTAHYDPEVLSFEAAVAAPGFQGVPLETTIASPGTVEVIFAYPAGDPTAESIVGSGETQLYLDFQMAADGGTSDLGFEDLQLRNSDGDIQASLSPATITVSDDPSVRLQPSTFGAIKARY